MENPYDIALSADGRSAYVASGSEATLAVLSLDPRTGAIRQVRGRRGCLAGRRLRKPDGPFGVRYGRSCTRVRGFGGEVHAVAVSPDGRFVYVTSGYGRRMTMAVFVRRAGGALRQLSGRSGCIAARRIDGCAVLARRNVGVVSIAPDGRQAYVWRARTLSTMARDPRTGALALTSCISSSAVAGCAHVGLGLSSLSEPTWAPDGRVGYVSATRETPDQVYAVILTLTRDPASGALSLVHGPSGCVTSAKLSDCTQDLRLGDLAQPPLISPDGRLVYTTATPIGYDVPLYPDVPFAIVGYVRAPDGALTRDSAACVSRLGRPGCVIDRHVAQLSDLQAAPDWTRLYASTGPTLSVFSLDPVSGAPIFIGRLRGCGFVARCGADVPMFEDPLIAPSPNGRFVYLVSSEDYGSGTVASLEVR